MVRFIKRHINSILWAVIILILCSAPSSSFPSGKFFSIPHFDKVVHFGLYLVFALLMLLELPKGRVRPGSAAVRVLVAVVYGLLIELMQLLVFRGRGAEYQDFMANTLGAVSALGLHKLLLGGAKNGKILNNS